MMGMSTRSCAYRWMAYPGGISRVLLCEQRPLSLSLGAQQCHLSAYASRVLGTYAV